jgi:hypothetical protein
MFLLLADLMFRRLEHPSFRDAPQDADPETISPNIPAAPWIL